MQPVLTIDPTVEGRRAARKVRGVLLHIRSLRQLQLDDTMVRFDTVNVGMFERAAASCPGLAPLGLEVLGFELSSVPVTCTL